MFAANAKRRLWYNAQLATMSGKGLGRVPNGVVACAGTRIVYAGPAAGLAEFTADERIDCGGRLITPGLIDCHTHLVYAGDRAHEFELRLKGARYEEIAKAGGGIAATVAATRAASEDELVAEALPRLDALLAEGLTTIEIKSGYGLSFAEETKMLRAARRLMQERDVRVRTSFLGAHVVAPEFAGNRSGYVAALCAMLPRLEGLADAVDGFCESIAFSPEEITTVFGAAAAAGLPVRLHADQLSDCGGAALAARFHALSADHLEFASPAGLEAMARSGTVAVLLPGAYYFLRETRPPDIAAMRQAGTAIAIASDSNPGTSPLTSLLLTLNMAATLFRLGVEECLRGVTCEAARALGLATELGTLEIGKTCDLAIWTVREPAELVYRMGFNPLYQRVRSGHDC
jgi:imidazolonepropionase